MCSCLVEALDKGEGQWTVYQGEKVQEASCPTKRCGVYRNYESNLKAL